MVSSQSKIIMALLFDVGGDMVATQEGRYLILLLQCYFYELISSLQNTLLGGRVEMRFESVCRLFLNGLSKNVTVGGRIGGRFYLCCFWLSDAKK